jgi:hypothetical protein
MDSVPRYILQAENGRASTKIPAETATPRREIAPLLRRRAIADHRGLNHAAANTSIIKLLLKRSWPRMLSQPHPWATAIAIDELDAGGLQSDGIGFWFVARTG